MRNPSSLFLYIYVMDPKYDVIIYILCFVSLTWAVIATASTFFDIGLGVVGLGVVGWVFFSKKKK